MIGVSKIFKMSHLGALTACLILGACLLLASCRGSFEYVDWKDSLYIKKDNPPKYKYQNGNWIVDGYIANPKGESSVKISEIGYERDNPDNLFFVDDRTAYSINDVVGVRYKELLDIPDVITVHKSRENELWSATIDCIIRNSVYKLEIQTDIFVTTINDINGRIFNRRAIKIYKGDSVSVKYRVNFNGFIGVIEQLITQKKEIKEIIDSINSK